MSKNKKYKTINNVALNITSKPMIELHEPHQLTCSGKVNSSASFFLSVMLIDMKFPPIEGSIF
jgi:hypothetical protein